MNNFFDTISNFIEGEQNFGNLGFILNLLYNIEYSKEPKIINFSKKGCFEFEFKEFSYELNIHSLKVSLRKLEIDGLNIDIDISSFSKEPKEKIILEAKDVNNQKSDDELTIINRILDYILHKNFIPEIEIKKLFISIGISQQHIQNTPRLEILIEKISFKNSDNSGKFFNKSFFLKDFRARIKPPFKTLCQNKINYFEHENIVAITNINKGKIVNEEMVIILNITEGKDEITIDFPLRYVEIVLDNLQLQYLNTILEMILFTDPKFKTNTQKTSDSNRKNQSFLMKKLSNVHFNFSLEMFNLVVFNNHLENSYKIWLSKRSQAIFSIELIKDIFCFYDHNFYLLNVQNIQLTSKVNNLKNTFSYKFEEIYFNYINSICHKPKEEKTEFCSIAEEESLNEEKTEEEKIQLYIQEQMNRKEYEYYSYNIIQFDGKLMDKNSFQLLFENEIFLDSGNNEIKQSSIIRGISSQIKLNFHPILFFFIKTINNDNFISLRNMLNDLIILKSDLKDIESLIKSQEYIKHNENDEIPDNKRKDSSEVILELEGLNFELFNFPHFEEFINFFSNDHIFGLQPYLFKKLKDENFKKYFENTNSFILSLKEVIILRNNFSNFSISTKNTTFSFCRDSEKYEILSICSPNSFDKDFPIKIHYDQKIYPKYEEKLIEDFKLEKISKELESIFKVKEKICANKITVDSNHVEINIFLENFMQIINFFDDFMYYFTFKDIFQIISKMNTIITKMYRTYNNLPYLIKQGENSCGIFSSFIAIDKLYINIRSLSENSELMKWVLEKIDINFSLIEYIKLMDLKINNLSVYLPQENPQNFHYLLYKPSYNDENMVEVCMKMFEMKKSFIDNPEYESYFEPTCVRNINREKYGYYLKEKFIYQNLSNFLEKNLLLLNDNEMYFNCEFKNFHLSPFTLLPHNYLYFLKIIRLLNNSLVVKASRYVICTPNKYILREISVSLNKLVIDLYSFNYEKTFLNLENRMRLLLIFKDLEVKYAENNEKTSYDTSIKTQVHSYFLRNLSYRNLFGKLEFKEDEYVKVGFVNIININEVYLVIRNVKEQIIQEDYQLHIGKISLHFCSDSLKYFLIFSQTFSTNNISDKPDKIEEINEIDHSNKQVLSILIPKSSIYIIKIDELDVFLYEKEDFNFEKNLKTISQTNQELKLIKPGKFDFKIHSNTFCYVENYFDDIYMKNQKMRNRSYSISKEEREIIHLKIVFLSVDLLKTEKIDGEIFSFSFTIMNYSIYDNSLKSKFYLLKQWNKSGNEINHKLFSLNLKGYSNEVESILDIFEIKQLPVELIIDLSTISFLMNFFNFLSDSPSIDDNKHQIVNKSELSIENKENTGNYIVRNFIISCVEFKINTRYKGSNHVFGNVLDTLAPKFIQIKNFEDNIKEFKRQYDLNDKFPLQITINELVDFYFNQFTKYSFLSNALSSIRILRPIGDFFNGIINVFRLPIKYYIKGDNVLIGLAHGVGNLFYKWTRGSYQLCKNVLKF